MPATVQTAAVPRNSKNEMIASGLRAYFRSRCPDGSLDEPVSLGSISDIDFAPNETTADLKSPYSGIPTTSRRIVTDVSGVLTLKLHEMAGTNILLAFRPVTTGTHSVAAGTGVELYDDTSF